MNLLLSGVAGVAAGLIVPLAYLAYHYEVIGPKRRLEREKYLQHQMEYAAKLNPRIVDDSMAKYPNSKFVWRAWCQIEVDNGIANPKTHERIKRYIARFPKDQYGALVHAKMLVDLQRDVEAEQILQTGMKPAKKSAVLRQILIEHAKIAARREDWPQAIARWQTVQTAFPDHVDGFMGEAGIHMKQRAYTLAERAVAQALRVSPRNEWGLWTHAYVADQAEQWPIAVERWAVFQKQFDTKPDGYMRGASACCKLGWYPQARRLIETARMLFASDKSTLQWCDKLAAAMPAKKA